MSINDMIAGGSGILIIALTLIQISPIKINPWSALARALGRAINGDVIKQLETLEAQQKESRKILDKHIIDGHRARILEFNSELLREISHTEEEYVDILRSIDEYQRYCSGHPDYQNNRAVHAIANIERVYDERMQKNDFL